MKPEEDAVGQVRMAYHKGQNSFEVYEWHDGFVDARREVTVSFSKYARAVDGF